MGEKKSKIVDEHKSYYKQYKVGDKGPAGGWIFAETCSKSGMWKYYEAAPLDAQCDYPWGDDGIFETKKGSGAKNTEKLVGKFIDRPINAVNYCTYYSCNGYSDWFLPSIDELNVMFCELKYKGIGDFKDGFYWSSSESSNLLAYAFNFEVGYDLELDRYFLALVRPIRTFTID